MAEDVAEATGLNEVFDIPPVPRPFGDNDLFGTFRLAQFDDRRDDERVRVDDLVAVVLDEVRLEDDALAAERNLGAKGLVLFADDFRQVAVVIRDPRDMD